MLRKRSNYGVLLAAAMASTTLSAGAAAHAQSSTQDPRPAVSACLTDVIQADGALGPGVTIEGVSISAHTFGARLPSGEGIEIQTPHVAFGEPVPASANNATGVDYSDKTKLANLRAKALVVAPKAELCFKLIR